MVQQERVYFTLRTILGSGYPSRSPNPAVAGTEQKPGRAGQGKDRVEDVVSRN
jgi:hypothetical protein